MEIMLNGPVIAGYEVYEDFYLYKKGTFVLFFPGRRLRAPFTKSCNEMRPSYWLLYSTN
jgi:hypothetical protein